MQDQTWSPCRSFQSNDLITSATLTTRLSSLFRVVLSSSLANLWCLSSWAMYMCRSHWCLGQSRCIGPPRTNAHRKASQRYIPIGTTRGPYAASLSGIYLRIYPLSDSKAVFLTNEVTERCTDDREDKTKMTLLVILAKISHFCAIQNCLDWSRIAALDSSTQCYRWFQCLIKWSCQSLILWMPWKSCKNRCASLMFRRNWKYYRKECW